MKFTDCVWYKNGIRASEKARRLAFQSAEPMYIVRDEISKTWGVGKGSSKPHWCQTEDGFSFIKVIAPVLH